MDTKQTPLSPELRHMHAYWRAANDLAVGQISLYDNPSSRRRCWSTSSPSCAGAPRRARTLSMCTSIVCTIVADMQEWDDDDEGQRTANIHCERPAWALSCDGGPGGGRARRGSRSAHGSTAFAALEQAGLPAPDAVGHRVITAAPTTRPTNGLMRALETICGGWPPTPRCMYRPPSRAWTDYPGTRKHGRASARS